MRAFPEMMAVLAGARERPPALTGAWSGAANILVESCPSYTDMYDMPCFFANCRICNKPGGGQHYLLDVC